MPRAGWLALGAVAGALAATAVSDTALCLLGSAVLLLVGVALHRSVNRNAGIVAIGASALLLRAGLGLAFAPPPGVNDPSTVSGPTHVAHVASVSSTVGNQQRVVLELEPPEQPERVYAWLPRYPSVAAFDVVRFKARLEPAGGDDSFAEYLARSGIGYTARIDRFDVVGSEDTPLAQLEGVRRASADLLARAVPQPQAGVGADLLVGLRDVVPRDVTADFRAAGLSYVLVVSGLHLNLVTGLAGSLLGRMSRRWRSVVLLVLIWCYTLLAGAGVAVVRAALMVTVVMVARETGRQSRGKGALAVTAVLMLLADPGIAGELGFQLSLAATAGVVVWSATFRNWLKGRLHPRTPIALIDGLGISLAALLATQPLILANFGQLSLVAPLSNVLAGPLIAPAMLTSAAALLTSAAASAGAPALVVTPFAVLAQLAVGALVGVAHACASLPLASLNLAPPFDLLAALLAAAAIAPFLRRSRRVLAPINTAQAILDARRQRTASTEGARRRRRLAVAAAVALAAVLASGMVAVAQPDGRLHMTVLDVGQGDSILLEGPRGGRILVDTGPDPDRLLTVLDGRLPAWDRRLDVVVITHPHEDHVGGLALLLDRYRIGEIAEPGMIGLGPGDAAFRRRLAELGRQTRLLAAGDRLFLDGIELDVLWPLPGHVPLHPADGGTAINNVSIVLSVQYGQRRFLLTGDIEQAVDPQLLAGVLAADGRPLDVLKVAHHGSATATTQAFLDRVSPRVAIVSVGWDNPYGHPAPSTVARLVARGTHLYRTDLDGSVSVSTNGVDLVTETSGGRPVPTRPTSVAPIGWGRLAMPGTLTGYSGAGQFDWLYGGG